MIRFLPFPILPLPGGLSRPFGLVPIEDLVRALLLAESKATLDGEAYNIASSQQVSKMEVAEWWRGRRPLGIPVPDSVLRSAHLIRGYANRIVHGGTGSRHRSHFRMDTHGSLMLGGPAYDISKASFGLGFQPEKPHAEAIRELNGSRSPGSRRKAR